MVLVRPVKLADLDQLEALAALTGVGLTTLPRDRTYLADRIDKSERAFAVIPNRPGGESYLFVMEDLATHTLIGTSGIVSKVGGFEPFYSYRIENSVFHSDLISVHKDVPTLTLHEEHDGPAEIGTLFLHPDFRHGGNGKLLQLVRFLFIAEHPKAFEESIVSEIRGVSDDAGRSPFWDAIGQHFFDIDFRRADYLSIVNKRFIADLMPDHPIYIPLLPQAAQDVIGVPHEQSRAAVKNLEAEGFKLNGMVDIFDAGPVMECGRDQVRTIRQSKRATIRGIGTLARYSGRGQGEGSSAESKPASSQQDTQSPHPNLFPEYRAKGPEASAFFMIATTAGEFRACSGSLEIADEGVTIPIDCANTLGLHEGDAIRFSPMPVRTD